MHEAPDGTPDIRAEKQRLLLALARKRQNEKLDGYYCIGDYHCGKYERDFVSPYTQSACNVDSEVFVMLQDWSCDDELRGPFKPDRADLGHDENWPTNRKLKELLRESLGLSLSDVYATNLFPFIKRGNASSRIKREHMVRAARDFALPQISIIRPKIVIALGVETFNALREALGLPRVRSAKVAKENDFCFESARVWYQVHTGSRWKQNNGSAGDWTKMKDHLDATTSVPNSTNHFST
jgi:restriction system protein